MGRCGRRGQSAELLFTFVEDENTISDIFSEINWEFLRGIAILQLYLEERWIEPIVPPQFPYALLYHQTMAYLASRGETSVAVLAQNILLLSPFKNISQEDYKKLIRHLIKIEQLQRTERGGLIIGRKGEGVINHFEFYSVFETPVEYLVRFGSQSIGTISNSIPIGTHFALAGRAWECIDLDEKAKVIFVKHIKGISKINWISSLNGEIYTNILRKMREVLNSNEDYAYLSDSCIEKLHSMRNFAKQSGFTTNLITVISNTRYAVFPWIGTKQMSALYFALANIGFKVQTKGYFLIIETKIGKVFLEKAVSEIIVNPPDKHNLELSENIEIPYKYNNFVPSELLRRQFVEDYIDMDGMKKDIFVCWK